MAVPAVVAATALHNCEKTVTFYAWYQYFYMLLPLPFSRLQARRQGGFEGVRPPKDFIYTPLNCTFKYPTVSLKVAH